MSKSFAEDGEGSNLIYKLLAHPITISHPTHLKTGLK